MFTLSKEAVKELHQAMIPNCPQCQSKSILVDQGPHTGKYYYCRGCKTEIDHPENTYGTIANMKRKIRAGAVAIKKSPQYVPINCTKVSCNNCHPIVQRLVTPVAIKPGDYVLCVNNNSAPSLNNGARYQVSGVTPQGISVIVGDPARAPGAKVMEFTRCRFQIEVKDETQVA